MSWGARVTCRVRLKQRVEAKSIASSRVFMADTSWVFAESRGCGWVPQCSGGYAVGKRRRRRKCLTDNRYAVQVTRAGATIQAQMGGAGHGSEIQSSMFW